MRSVWALLYLGSGVGHEPWTAGAGCAMAVDVAHRVGAARWVLAGIWAPVVSTGLAGRAVFVRVAAEDTHVVQTDVTEETIVVYTACHCNRTMHILKSHIDRYKYKMLILFKQPRTWYWTCILLAKCTQNLQFNIFVWENTSRVFLDSVLELKLYYQFPLCSAYF